MATFEELQELVLEHGGLVNRIRKEQEKKGQEDYRNNRMKEIERMAKNGQMTNHNREHARDMKNSYISRNGTNRPIKEEYKVLKDGDYKSAMTAVHDSESYKQQEEYNKKDPWKKSREERLQEIKSLPSSGYYRNKHDEKMAKIESNGKPYTSERLEYLKRLAKQFEADGDKTQVKNIKKDIAEEEKRIQKTLKDKSKENHKNLKSFRKEQKKLMKESEDILRLEIYECERCGIITDDEKEFLLSSF